jgi:hypothetical protein
MTIDAGGGRTEVQINRILLDPDRVRENIAKRAYFMYLNSAESHGDDLKHWLAAEEQTHSERKRRRLCGSAEIT